MLKTAIGVRKEKKVWELGYREAWVDDSLYAFSKGAEVFPVFHIGNGRQQTIPVPNFENGVKYCNYYGWNDCITVQNKCLTVSVGANEVKLYVKA